MLLLCQKFWSVNLKDAETLKYFEIQKRYLKCTNGILSKEDSENEARIIKAKTYITNFCFMQAKCFESYTLHSFIIETSF